MFDSVKKQIVKVTNFWDTKVPKYNYLVGPAEYTEVPKLFKLIIIEACIILRYLAAIYRQLLC